MGNIIAMEWVEMLEKTNCMKKYFIEYKIHVNGCRTIEIYCLQLVKSILSKQKTPPRNLSEERKELNIYRLNPALLKKDELQEYMDLYIAENDEKYISWSLHSDIISYIAI